AAKSASSAINRFAHLKGIGMLIHYPKMRNSSGALQSFTPALRRTPIAGRRAGFSRLFRHLPNGKPDGKHTFTYMAARLQGIFTPTLVPVDERGEINEPELRRFLSWLIDRGVHGLYPNGSTGEFTRFTPEERQRIVRITCEEARGRVPVLAGAAEANIKETLGACEAYAAMGATAVAIVSPFYYRLSAESVYAYFAEIARDTPIDVTLYNIPMFASPIDVPTIRRLAEFPRVIGIKD